MEESVANEAKVQLSKVPLEKAEPLARATLEAAKQKLGMIPNMYAYMANAPGLLETYRSGYDLFRQASGFTPVEQEVILLSISYENGCEYCMAAHSFLADVQSKVPREVGSSAQWSRYSRLAVARAQPFHANPGSEARPAAPVRPGPFSRRRL